jgi:hypothetical protein
LNCINSSALPNDSKKSSIDGIGCVGDDNACNGRVGLLFEFCVNGIKKNGSIVLEFDGLKEIGIVGVVGVWEFSLTQRDCENIGKFGI